MWFLWRIYRILILWTAQKSIEAVLREADTTRPLITRIHKGQANFFGYVMRREKLEHLVTTGLIERKHSRGKQREKMLNGLPKRLKVG